jgi:hypothetical protein
VILPERPLQVVADKLSLSTDGAELRAKLGDALISRVYSRYMGAWQTRTIVAEVLGLPFEQVEQATILLFCSRGLAKHTKATGLELFREVSDARRDPLPLEYGDEREEPYGLKGGLFTVSRLPKTDVAPTGAAFAQVEQAILALLRREPLRTEEIVARMGGHAPTVRSEIDMLAECGMIEASAVSRAKAGHRWTIALESAIELPPKSTEERDAEDAARAQEAAQETFVSSSYRAASRALNQRRAEIARLGKYELICGCGHVELAKPDPESIAALLARSCPSCSRSWAPSPPSLVGVEQPQMAESNDSETLDATPPASEDAGADEDAPGAQICIAALDDGSGHPPPDEETPVGTSPAANDLELIPIDDFLLNEKAPDACSGQGGDGPCASSAEAQLTPTRPRLAIVH